MTEIARLSTEEMKRGNAFIRTHGIEQIVPGQWSIAKGDNYYRIVSRAQSYIVRCRMIRDLSERELGRIPFNGSRPEAFAKAILLIVIDAEGV